MKRQAAQPGTPGQDARKKLDESLRGLGLQPRGTQLDRSTAGDDAQRFLKRYRAQVREAVARAIGGRKIAEADRDASISIPARDLNEPTFQHGPGGKREVVLPGNKQYVTGDEIQRPPGGGGGSGGGSCRS